MRKLGIWICLLMIMTLCACRLEEIKKVRDIDFTVVEAEEIPEELKLEIEERKEEAFTLILKDGEFMYLAVGYGKKDGMSYDLQVESLFLGENAVYVTTVLMGNEEKQQTGETDLISYPHIVIKMENMDYPVVFER